MTSELLLGLIMLFGCFVALKALSMYNPYKKSAHVRYKVVPVIHLTRKIRRNILKRELGTNDISAAWHQYMGGLIYGNVLQNSDNE
jgi:hypothetical protein